MTLLTFLGTGNYHATTYRPCDFSSLGMTEHQREISTAYFASALAQWSQPDLILVVTTPEATSKHQGSILAELKGFSVEFLELPLQTGNESDLWTYFELLTNHLTDTSDILADITHGFRSTPIVTLLALSYLRVTRQVTVRGLYYGAFDAVPRDELVKPTFDLSPFLELFQWTSAADSYLHTGDATRLGEIIHTAQKSLWADPARSKNDNPRSLIPLAKAIKESSADLRLLRMQDLASSLSRLETVHQKAREEIDQFLPPFAQLIEVVKDDLTRHRSAALTSSTPGKDQIPDQTDLHSQLDLIEWLVTRGHTAAALTLAREWLVTSLAAHLSPSAKLPLVYSKRKPFEKILTSQTSPRAGMRGNQPDPELFEAYQSLPEHKTVLFEKLWSQTTQPRNDLNHASHNDHSHKASSLELTVSSLLKQFPLLLPAS